MCYDGVDRKRNGVGVILKEVYVKNPIEVKGMPSGNMSLKLDIKAAILNVVSAYGKLNVS